MAEKIITYNVECSSSNGENANIVFEFDDLASAVKCVNEKSAASRYSNFAVARSMYLGKRNFAQRRCSEKKILWSNNKADDALAKLLD